MSELTKPKISNDSMVILMADDDDDDFLLTRKALADSELSNKLQRVRDGEELMDYLQKSGEYKTKPAPRPAVILLDLNMPKMDGREALKAIKTCDELHDIPVVVFTTSKAEEDIVRSYQLGVNSFITKPVTYDGLTSVMKALGKYWFEIVELPSGDGRG